MSSAARDRYAEYLQSDHWQEIRRAALWIAGYRCQLCNQDNAQLDVHHRTYERRGRERPGDVIVLCRACHSKFHGVVTDLVPEPPMPIDVWVSKIWRAATELVRGRSTLLAVLLEESGLAEFRAAPGARRTKGMLPSGMSARVYLPNDFYCRKVSQVQCAETVEWALENVSGVPWVVGYAVADTDTIDRCRTNADQREREYDADQVSGEAVG